MHSLWPGDVSINFGAAVVSGFVLLQSSLSLWQYDVLFTSVIMPVRTFLGFDKLIVSEVYFD